jgi:DNA-binding transcriptional LysR family regulator
VTWSELYEHEYVSVDKTSGNRLLLDQALSGVAPPAPSICETRHVTTMLGLVEAGLGVAAVPSMAMPGRDHPILTSVPLVEPVVKRRVGIVRRRGRPLTPAAQEFHRAIVESKRDGFVSSDGPGDGPGDDAAASERTKGKRAS